MRGSVRFCIFAQKGGDRFPLRAIALAFRDFRQARREELREADCGNQRKDFWMSVNGSV